MGATLNGPFKELVNFRIREFEYHYNGIVLAIFCDPNKVIDIREWSIFWRWSVREVLLKSVSLCFSLVEMAATYELFCLYPRAVVDLLVQRARCLGSRY